MINGQFCSLSLALIQRFLRTISPFLALSRDEKKDEEKVQYLFFSSLYSEILLFEAYMLTLPLFLKSNSKSRRTRLQRIVSLVMANIFKLRLINKQQTTDTLRCSVFLARFNVERRDEEERERTRGKTDGKKRDFSGGVAACNQGPDE